jgi:hypothetical protein
MDLPDGITLYAGHWVQNTPVITPEGDVYFEQANIYGERNSARMRDYHRLDLAAKFKTKNEKGRKAEWTFSILQCVLPTESVLLLLWRQEGRPVVLEPVPRRATNALAAELLPDYTVVFVIRCGFS